GMGTGLGMMWRLGGRDHEGLRYTSLMPNPAARLYTALRAAVSPRTHHVERDYRTWIYSFAGYRQLLESCGFVRIERYASIPGYNVPTSLVPLESNGPMRWMTDRVRARPGPRAVLRRAAARVLAAAGGHAWLTSCYALIAQRPEGRA